MTLSTSLNTQEIPSYLIYEMDDGQPIYYRSQDIPVMKGVSFNLQKIMEQLQ